MGRLFDPRLPGHIFPSDSYTEDMRYLALFDQYGSDGERIFNILYCKIDNTEGYYTQITDQILRQLHEKMGKRSKGIKWVSSIIEYCCEIGLYDKATFISNNVITSVKIQDNWLRAKLKARNKIPNNLKYWLLGNNFCDINTDKCYNNSDKCNKNTDKYYNNSDYCSTKGRETSKLINNNNNDIKGELSEPIKNYELDKILEEKFNKTTDPYFFKYTFENSEKYECNIEYLNYIINACNDIGEKMYGQGKATHNDFRKILDKLDINDIVAFISEINYRKDYVKTSKEYYVRGAFLNKYKELLTP